MHKTYHALVMGEAPACGVIEKRLRLTESATCYRSFVHPDGKAAKTSYVRTALLRHPASGACYSLLAVTPETGRTHQIRAHLAHIGHAIATDAKYAPRRKVAQTVGWCPRLFLHAARLEIDLEIGFEHANARVKGGAKMLRAEAPLPPDLTAALATLVPVEIPTDIKSVQSKD